MSIQNYGTSASRNLIRAAQGMLEHAQPITVLGDFGTQREMPQNSTDTLVFRRTLPFGASTAGTTIENTSRYVGTPDITASNFVLAEGVPPNSNTISFQDVTVQLQQYGVLFKYSSKVEQLYEDDIPGEMVKLTGETLAEVMEMVRYGVLKAGSTVIYANGSSRAAVATPVSLNALRLALSLAARLASCTASPKNIACSRKATRVSFSTCRSLLKRRLYSSSTFLLRSMVEM